MKTIQILYVNVMMIMVFLNCNDMAVLLCSNFGRMETIQILSLMMKIVFLDCNQRLHLNLFDEYVQFYKIFVFVPLCQVLFGSQNSN